MARNYDLAGIDLLDTQYTVVQSSVRNKYKAMDAAGNTVLRGKHEMFEMQDEFPFTDGAGTEVFTVTASGRMDIAGDYLLTDSHTGEDLVVLDNDFSLLQDTWRIRDAEDRTVIATLHSRGAVFTLARKLLPIGELIPHKYEIVDATGEQIGSIDGQLSLRDQYDITIEETASVPKAPIVAGAMVIDAIQGN